MLWRLHSARHQGAHTRRICYTRTGPGIVGLGLPLLGVSVVFLCVCVLKSLWSQKGVRALRKAHVSNLLDLVPNAQYLRCIKNVS